MLLSLLFAAFRNQSSLLTVAVIFINLVYKGNSNGLNYFKLFFLQIDFPNSDLFQPFQRHSYSKNDLERLLALETQDFRIGGPIPDDEQVMLIHLTPALTFLHERALVTMAITETTRSNSLLKNVPVRLQYQEFFRPGFVKNSWFVLRAYNVVTMPLGVGGDRHKI